jgi:hypothetical protein
VLKTYMLKFSFTTRIIPGCLILKSHKDFFSYFEGKIN